jgi:hypothetical protein
MSASSPLAPACLVVSICLSRPSLPPSLTQALATHLSMSPL